MPIAIFQMRDMVGRSQYFEKIFLLADIDISVALDMLFFILSNVEINFLDYELVERSFITADVLPTIKRIKLVEKRGFAAMALSPDKKMFVVHIMTFSLDLDVHHFVDLSWSHFLLTILPQRFFPNTPILQMFSPRNL